jgi:hypothetical protein
MTKTPQELADFLKNYNCWRRGSYLHEQPAPTELGQVLDQVIAILEAPAQQQTIVLSDCCEAPAVVAGKPGSTQWYACPDCYDPCDVFIRTTITQPQP